MNESNIKKSLRQCKKATNIGYKLATTQYKEINAALLEADERIHQALESINSSSIYVSEATEGLTSQFIETRNNIETISSSMQGELVDLKETKEKFSITLFGRTMVGKSTLKEILTHGNGESIGLGAQRTTRDIRTYEWNDMTITDVPGIGAFEGEEDENLAFWSAKKADLILFLITDDGPQVTDAEWLAKIINLGKPVICVINVKSSLRLTDSLETKVKKINHAFNQKDMEDLKNQFIDYSYQFGQDWTEIPYIFVHLKAAFDSQSISSDYATAQTLYETSRFEKLTEHIINEVNTHGKYYREKNFADIVSVPSIEIFEDFLMQSDLNVSLNEIITYKKTQLQNWGEKFYRDAEKQIESLINHIHSELLLKIPGFAEEHFEDKKADVAWNSVVAESNIDEKCRQLINDLQESADNRLSELAREIENELRFMETTVNQEAVRIQKMHAIFDMKKAWNWGILIAGGGLSITAGILGLIGCAAAGPIGWAALIVSGLGIIGSLIFSNKGKKSEQARKKLETALQNSTEDICKSLIQQMNTCLSEIYDGRIVRQINELDHISYIIKNLADTQQFLAERIRPRILEQNKQVLSGALKMIWAGRFSETIGNVARVPGKTMVAFLNESRIIPDKKSRKLTELIQENLFMFGQSENDIEKIMSDKLGKIIVREHSVLIESLPITPDLLTWIRILEQLSGKYIKNREEQ